MKIVNRYLTNNRPYTKRKTTTAIAIHWVGNPGSTAEANRNYFQNTDREVSANYIVGLEGEVICCIPDEEVSWCTNQANSYSVSIENCHPDATGRFADATYSALVELTAQLCKKYGLHPKNGGVIRHFDVTGKVCPKWFVPKAKGGSDDDNNTNWKTFLANVSEKLDGKTSSSAADTLYRVRKTWADSKSQIGAFRSLENAKKACAVGYAVFDDAGKIVYSKTAVEAGNREKGQKVTISANTPLFANDGTTTPAAQLAAGEYYLYDGVPCGLGRYRITTKREYCGKTPAGKYVTGFVSWDRFQ